MNDVETWTVQIRVIHSTVHVCTCMYIHCAEVQLLLQQMYIIIPLQVVFGEGRLEVWGTMENNRLLLLQRTSRTGWKHSQLVVNPKEARLKLCSHVVCASFTSESGKKERHIWISYRQKSVLVSFNAYTKEQRCILNCADKLRRGKSNFSLY